MSKIQYTLAVGYFDSELPEVFYDSDTPFGPFNVGDKMIPDHNHFSERAGEPMTIDRIEHTLYESSGTIKQGTKLFLK
jgi:hypothetical protein